MQWLVRNRRLQNQESVASFYSLWLVVLRCFEIPLTEAERRKGRELLAKRGEQKIRKNQVQAGGNFLVATSRIVGHRPRLPTHQQSLIPRNCLIQIPVIQTRLCKEHVT